MKGNVPPSALIRRRFQDSFSSYEQHAIVQKKVAHMLCERVVSFAPPAPYIMEIGCGTGFLTRLLLNRCAPARLITNDLVPEAQTYLPPHPAVYFIAGDAEKIDYPAPLDIVIGGGVLQWIRHPEHVFQKALKALRKGGLVAFSIFGPLTMIEVTVLTHCRLPFRSLSWYVHTLRKTGFLPLIAEECFYTLFFSSALEALYHIKHTGTHAPGHGWKGSICEIVATYEKTWKQGNTVPLTYQVFLLIGRKPSNGTDNRDYRD
ncbi:methyltransferase domain-containing protein [Spirochaeta thermophila]|nr:methyltransferase domain-containing protein [Spirochaeta thermophila]